MKYTDEPERIAFEMFADAYPHEAADDSFDDFLAYTRRRAGEELTEERVRKALEDTAAD
jgi:hypothetical protein